MFITWIHTLNPATGRIQAIPACELYRTHAQASAQVMRREYEAGILTWLTHTRCQDWQIAGMTPIDELF